MDRNDTTHSWQVLFLCVPLRPLRLCVEMFVVSVDFNPVSL